MDGKQLAAAAPFRWLAASILDKAKVDFVVASQERKNRHSTQRLSLTRYWRENGKKWIKPLDDFATT
jgi:hypothetical protein